MKDKSKKISNFAASQIITTLQSFKTIDYEVHFVHRRFFQLVVRSNC